MYTPGSFRIDDFDKLCDFIAENSFGILVSSLNNQVSATHLPLLIDRESGACGKIIGHLAAANSHWSQGQDQEALVIFQGPHAYISPSWYESKNVVPTWNYTAVHVRGMLRVTRDRDDLLDIVARYVEFYERHLPTPWRLGSTDADFIDQLLKGIVGFRIEIDSIEGKFKLSQNHTVERRLGVIRQLKSHPGEQQQKIAQLMEQSLEDRPDAEP